VTSARRFPGRPESVTAARRFVRAVLSDQSREIVDAAELMTCELVTNCVQHAHCDFELAIHSHEEIRIEVRDASRGIPVRRSPAPQDPSGRGLRIVEAMSDTWGIIPSETGKTVWFVLQPGASHDDPSSAASRERLVEDGDRRAPGSALSPPRQGQSSPRPGGHRRRGDGCSEMETARASRGAGRGPARLRARLPRRAAPARAYVRTDRR